MKKRIFIISVFIVALASLPVMAMQGHDSKKSGEIHDMKSSHEADHSAHGDETESSAGNGTFKHHASVEGVDAEFQVMSLTSMNMTSDKGETHHIMVNLSTADDGSPIKNTVGKIKVIGPDGKEQISTLKNYSGILAANFTFKVQGKYGVICLVKNEDKKHVFKFWYHHM
jgi:hypothetical protein